ncbi:MAG: TonB-dependent receptor, partial [Catalinimonas sp.]
DEVRPSGGVLNRDLRAERGVNWEVGGRLHPDALPLYLDVSAFYLRLDNTIVERQDDATGRERYRNTGTTDQRGLEALLTWDQTWTGGAVERVRGSLAYTGHFFAFADYRTEAGDSTGNALPGVPRQQLVGTFDLHLRKDFYCNLTVQRTGEVPLNDANTVFAGAFTVAHARVGWGGGRVGPFRTDIFFGVNNLFDTDYSLGNDLNAFGRRYFQPAAGRNWYGGVALCFGA